MTTHLNNDWQEFLKETFHKDYFVQLTDFVHKQYQSAICYPPTEHIFNAFNHCSLEQTKVILLGQDPYHGQGQANGLSFSVNDGVALPPSLINIFKELEQDMNIPIPISGNLERWAKQGVLLLNATLTVEKGKAGSHQGKGWEIFTDTVIHQLSGQKEHLVFLLWGNYAKNKLKLIDTNKHLVLTAGHPSPMSANRGYWFGNKHFSQTNSYLQEHKLTPIEW
ncbi:MAG: uracil-DNA glycosylase [Bacteroidota bacterium]|nr:uracil-DNA glycosylase [Bacteroidota bacterium]